MLPRVVRHHPFYVVFGSVSLALAVGATLSVFTVVNALWLRPVPFPDADRLVTLIPNSLGFVTLDAPSLQDARAHVFEALAGQAIVDDDRGMGTPPPRLILNGRQVETVGVTSEYFGLFGIHLRGRDFTSADDTKGAEPVAIISDRLWSQEFARRSDVIGSLLAAQPLSIRIVGIAPADFEGARRGERTDVWIPSTLVPRVAGALADDVTLMVFARLSVGVSSLEATRYLSSRDPAFAGLVILSLKEIFGTPTSRTIPVREGQGISVVAGLAALVLAGGCATLAALILVHYERRRRELAVRLAIGASRSRLAGELVHELLVIAATGAVGALLVAVWGLHVIPALNLPGGVNLGRLDLSIDWRVLGAAIATTALTLAAAAALPIARFTRSTLAGDLVAGPCATPTATSQRIRQTLLGLHVTATIIVLVSAGLFVRAVVRGFGRGAGFNIEQTAFVTVDVTAPSDFASIKKPSDWNSFDRASLIRIRGERKARIRSALTSVPGVIEVANGSSPVGPDPAALLFKPATLETNGIRREILVGRLSGSAELHGVLGLQLLTGRKLNPADEGVNPVPALVTVSLAQTLWPGENPLGRTVRFVGGRFGAIQVVGMTADFVFGSFARPAAGVIMTVDTSSQSALAQYVVRSADAEGLVEPVRRAAREAMPGTRWVKVATGREIVARDLGRQRLGAWFFSGFGVTALLLGIGGVFGLAAYLAESRRREFGVRMALGATARELVQHGVSAALFPVVCGVAAGLVLAAWIARLFTSLLVGVSAFDPLTYGTAAGTLLASAALAGLIGAWRLRKLAPLDALRTE